MTQGLLVRKLLVGGLGVANLVAVNKNKRHSLKPFVVAVAVIAVCSSHEYYAGRAPLRLPRRSASSGGLTIISTTYMSNDHLKRRQTLEVGMGNSLISK